MLTIFKACNSGVVRNCCPIPTIHLTNLACSLSNSFLWHGFKNIASHPYNKNTKPPECVDIIHSTS